MKQVKISLMILLSVLAVMLDLAFFSSITIYDTGILISLSLLNLLVLFGTSQTSVLVVSLAVSLAFTALSSLPIPVIGIIFFIWPNLLWYIRQGYVQELSTLVILLYLAISNFVFELIFLAFFSFQQAAWSNTLILQLVVFVILNTLIGFFFSLLAVKLIKLSAPASLSVRKELK